AALGNTAVLERRAPVRAMKLEQADASGLVAKDDEILAHDPDAQRHVGQVAGEGNGLPEAPQVLAARRAWTHPNQLVVRRRHLAGKIGTVRCVEKGARCAHGSPYTTTARRAAGVRDPHGT